MKMKKLKNVLKGHLSHDVIEDLNVIDHGQLRVLYSGPLISFENPVDSMKEYRNKILERNVITSYVSGRKLHMFIE